MESAHEHAPASRQEPERIQQAALRVNGQLYVGPSHFEALKALKKENPKWGSVDVTSPEQGFVTSTGRFVSRDEAAEIAFRAEQIDIEKAELDSQDITVH